MEPTRTAVRAVALGRLSTRADTARLATDRALRSPHPVAVHSTSVWGRVAELAAADPDRVAVVAGAATVSYRDLCRRVRQFQATLCAAGCGPGDRVAVTGPRGADLIAAFLAIESLGAAYLPVDAEWPAARVTDMLSRASPRCLLVTGPGQARSAAAAPATVPVVEAPTDTAPVAPPMASRVAAADEPRYVIHTSGSSGRPKGAVVCQSGLLNHLWSMVAVLRLTAADTVAFSAPPGYVISVWQMVAVLLVGGRVAVVGDRDVLFSQRLAGAVARAGVTVMELVPTMIGWIVAELRRSPAAELPALRCLLSTGEKLTPALAADVLETLPGVEFVNAYGATECSDDVALHVVTPADLTRSRLPAGTPMPGTVLYLLVEAEGRWRAAEPGEPGELWVGGEPVGGGYLGDPDLTRAAFVVDDFDPDSPTGRLYRTGDLAVFDDGLLHCLGRADRQAKIAGVRMELDEIEASIARLPGVTECAVVVDDRPQLAAYWVAGSDATQEELYAALREQLPVAMCPRRWIRLAALPRNGNGKVDRRALAGGPR